MTRMMIDVAEIEIPSYLAHSKPSESKIEAVLGYVKENGTMDKPILVDSYGLLRDGYIRYLVAKRMGMEMIDAIVTEDSSYEYITAMFLRNSKKTYHWVNIKNLPISIGDIVSVKNRRGKASVVVTGIYRSDRWLGHKPVKSVIKKCSKKSE